MLLTVTCFFTGLAFLLPRRQRGEASPDFNLIWRMALALLSAGLWLTLALTVSTIDIPQIYISQTTYTYTEIQDTGGAYHIVVDKAANTPSWNIYTYEATGTGTLIFFGIGVIMLVYTIHLILSILQQTVPMPKTLRPEEEWPKVRG